MKRMHKMVLFLTLIGAGDLCFSMVIAATPYYAVVDAGSGGSRLYLYRVDLTVQTSPQITQIPDAGSKKKPGISTQLDGCAAYIAPLFTSLNTYLNANNIQQSDVTVSLQATAGMRVISPVEQNACYDAVKTQLFSTLPGVVIGPIQTIQGRYEGAFQWMAVNYLKGTFNQGARTVGVLEVGGGSYQMTFESPGKGTIDFITVPFGDKTYGLFSRSYTGLGGNFSREDATDDPNAFQVGFQLASGAVGTGKYMTGKLSARKSIRAKPTAIPAQAKKPDISSFVGVGLFWNVAQSLNLNSEISPSSIDAAGKTLALQPYDTNTKDPYAFSMVFNAQLISEIIQTWFGDKAILKVEDTINGSDITWTLGAAVFMAQNGLMQK